MPHPLLLPAVAEVALITYRDVKSGTNATNPVPHLPMPSQYVSVFVVFGGLSILPPSADRLASLMAWGFVVATALNVFTPGKTVASTNVGGTPTVTGASTKG